MIMHGLDDRSASPPRHMRPLGEIQPPCANTVTFADNIGKKEISKAEKKEERRKKKDKKKKRGKVSERENVNASKNKF
ncbi:hypothetical protein TL16_g04684 [Triparma laevis f. inornata]|uniref:Uncharacterized protein n=2 Tax=Triparma laevis TaxID=1534972 RepID=A0A9W7AUT0_9STRA|nr:hypothetical protein TL16_g04684 [Triparma laevis f. inornata]GMH76996.1 hypothetical protein TrLO_g5944 [Triparma laevis f. longispina]